MTGYTVLRARREFANQSNVGFMLTSTNRQLVDDGQLPRRRRRTPAAWTTTGASDAASTSPATGPAAASPGSPEAITRLQENTVHAFQRPDADHVEVDPLATVVVGTRRVGRVRQDRRREDAIQQLRSATRAPGFDINDLGFQRRADERNVSNWFQMRDNVPGRFTRSFIWNLNQWSGWNFDGDRAVQRRQRQHALDVEELLSQRLWREPERRAAAATA